MKVQKFKKGDLVRIAKDLGPSMSHFQSDCDAIIIGSYADKYRGDNTDSYTLHLKGRGQVSWYEEHQLTLIKPNCIDLLRQWEAAEAAEFTMRSNLDWIFSHGEEVLDNKYGASVGALAACFGVTNLWGRRGEGITYYSNMMETLLLAKPFLQSEDKVGWLKKAKELM